jgi:hypothetical protein
VGRSAGDAGAVDAYIVKNGLFQDVCLPASS